ncbi:beta/gamma crystallin-related protein [Sunxiuqinia sp. A32]|uniref:beta/gamma crystallin-related protein n=1 Tax=Sunxiuqinia sp. A32 TaxID=3461496 RepID=UPI004045B7B1
MKRQFVVIGVFIVLSIIQLKSIAQSSDVFLQWSEKTFAQIERDFRLSGSNLYRENTGSQNIAFNWPQGVQLHALIAAGKIEDAEALANEMHEKYWCYFNNIWAYNSSANNCGDRYYDDNAWIAKALVELYFETNNDTYLDRAKEVIAFSMSGENHEGDDPAGGIRWHEGDPGQCLCSTAPTMTTNLMIYQATGEAKYLDDGKRLYDWVRANRFGLGGGYRGYENAVITQAAIRVYEITEESSYYEDARHMGLAMETVYIDYNNHALHETGQWGGHDMTAAYFDLYELDGDINWLNIVSGYLTFLHNNCKDLLGRYPEDWSDADAQGDPSLLYQASVARAYGHMSNTPGGSPKYPDPVAIYRDIDFDGFYSAGLSIGEYTAADLEFLGMPDNSITSFKVRPGYRITLYKEDNFQGQSMTRTSDTNWIGGDFNDVVSSILVEVVDTFAIAYSDCNYSGKAVNLPARDYTLADLQARGINQNDISSIQVGEGYQVTLFKGKNLDGDSFTVPNDIECLESESWNDSTNSIRIECSADLIVPYLAINDGELEQTSTAEVFVGGSVKFSPQPETGGSWSWIGPKLARNTREVILENIEPGQSGNYIVSYINNDGLAQEYEFTLNVQTTVATIFADCDFGDNGIKLTVGDYDMFALNSIGMANDDISSIKIASGFEVEVFSDYNFSNNAQTLFDDDDCLDDDGINNWISSLIVREKSTPTGVALTGASKNSDLLIYPNPANNRLHVEFEGSVEKMNFSIYNNSGHLSMKGQLYSNWIDISSLDTGLFFLVIQTDNETLNTKFIKK